MSKLNGINLQILYKLYIYALNLFFHNFIRNLFTHLKTKLLSTAGSLVKSLPVAQEAGSTPRGCTFLRLIFFFSFSLLPMVNFYFTFLLFILSAKYFLVLRLFLLLLLLLLLLVLLLRHILVRLVTLVVLIVIVINWFDYTTIPCCKAVLIL